MESKKARKERYHVPQGCHVTCFKIAIIALNAIFVIIGVVLLGGGLFVALGANEALSSMVNQTLSTIPLIPQQAQLTDYVITQAQSSTSGLGINLDVAAVLQAAYITLIVLGALILAVSLLGCTGACCPAEGTFYIYVIVTSVLWFVQFLLVVLLGSGALSPHIKSYLQGFIRDKYKGIDDFSLHALAINYIMVEFECCGVESFTEFSASTTWDRTRSFSIGGNASMEVTLVTPIACCVILGEFPDITMADRTCAYIPTYLNNNFEKGCYDEIVHFLEPWEEIAYGTASVFLFLQLIIIIVSASTQFILERYNAGDTKVAVLS